jgi:ATP-dependent DNA helicase RecG
MDWSWVKEQPEGQFLERKSAYDQTGGALHPRPVKEVVRDIAEALVAMANADGGTVVLGIEDDGTVSGVPERYDPEKVRAQIHDLTRPRLNFRLSEVLLEGKPTWVFETDWSAEVHQLTDGRYLLRIGSQTQPFPAADIEAMKRSRLQRATEMQFPPDASLEDLDLNLLEELGRRSGMSLSPEEILIHYRLAERANGHLRLTLAAVLLFGKDLTRWHPRCGIEFVRWQGKERKTGAELNITKRLRMEAPLVRLVEEAFRTIQTYIPERQYLVDLFFEERFAYPTFAWQEAIVNAVAHRDYRLQGLGIEVHLFDDRMEIWSPGELVEPVTLDRLRRRERVHTSRNPRIVRVLTAFGYMRELGEGIPRMFEVMEREGLRPPEFRLEGGRFVVTLHSTPIYRPETMRWLRRFEEQGLTRHQTRLLAYAYEHGGRFTSRAYQKLVGVDIYTASRDIKDLIRRGIVRLTRPRGRVYELVPEPEKAPREKPPELLALEPILREKGYVKNEDIQRVFAVSRMQALRLLNRLTDQGFLRKEGKGRGARYVAAQNASILW